MLGNELSETKEKEIPAQRKNVKCQTKVVLHKKLN